MARVVSYGMALLFAASSVVHAATQRAAYAPPPEYPAEAKTRHLTGSTSFASMMTQTIGHLVVAFWLLTGARKIARLIYPDPPSGNDDSAKTRSDSDGPTI